MTAVIPVIPGYKNDTDKTVKEDHCRRQIAEAEKIQGGGRGRDTCMGIKLTPTRVGTEATADFDDCVRSLDAP
ncbi:MAG: hypothetical protein ACLTW9_02025 [Enterocloster sp.]